MYAGIWEIDLHGKNEYQARVTLDAARCEVTHDGRTAELTKNELRILVLLMRSA